MRGRPTEATAEPTEARAADPPPRTRACLEEKDTVILPLAVQGRSGPRGGPHLAVVGAAQEGQRRRGSGRGPVRRFAALRLLSRIKGVRFQDLGQLLLEETAVGAAAGRSVKKIPANIPICRISSPCLLAAGCTIH